ncbi:PadR family transcriptional regulator [Sphingomonas sp. TX0543]|uniref:PadR family transcriptional regulator n=1 Tax=unclassified Sphingomonas TaxID=196159 RepID=UPI0010F7B8A5|nr:PadR family transcriptional regulator [Sphingomonas sp. 3P27F8]
MFPGLHSGKGRHCGPRGEWSRGPFSVEWDFRGRRGGHGGGGGRGKRMFDGGELRLVLLKLIADEPRHGYELIRAVEELTGGEYAPSPGIVYPTLTLLDEMGFIADQASGDEKRKRYAATDEGRAHLEENREQVEALIERLENVGERRQRTDGAPIRRAMGNLRVALEHRLTKGDFSQDTLHDVAALIDEVAQKIERLR